MAGLSWPSTSFLRRCCLDVDARDKPGHDELICGRLCRKRFTQNRKSPSDGWSEAIPILATAALGIRSPTSRPSWPGLSRPSTSYSACDRQGPAFARCCWTLPKWIAKNATTPTIARPNAIALMSERLEGSHGQFIGDAQPG